MERNVPLVIPEVNPDHLALIDIQRDRGRDGFIVTNPNCSTIMLCMALAPLRKFKFSDIRVATMQAVSGAGRTAGVLALDIVDNIIPFIPGEEEKSEKEPLKILGGIEGGRFVNDNSIKVSAHCNRVPVVDGHTACVSLEFGSKKPSLDEILDYIAEKARVRLDVHC
jgi:aspartate-semialdehyde dehydrogenase